MQVVPLRTVAQWHGPLAAGLFRLIEEIRHAHPENVED